MLSSLSAGIQCELGQESYRNCLAIKVEPTSPGTTDAPCQNGDMDLQNELRQTVNGSFEESSEEDCSSNLQAQLVCGICFKAFSVSVDLEKHCMTHHNGETPFKCHQCSAAFRCWLGNKGLKFHLENLHPPCSTVICKLEDSETGSIASNPVSPNKFSNVEFCEFVCGDCGLQFSDAPLYETHCKVHNPKEPFKCVECSLRFKRCLTIEEHRASHLLVGPYSCDQCGKEYSFKWSLLMHTQIIHGIRPQHFCDKCGLGFLNAEFLSGHTHLHSVEEYSIEIDLKSVNVISMDEDKTPSAILECEECDLEFATETDLAMHSHIHQGPQTFKCEQCPTECDSYAELKQHVNSKHSDVEMQWCEDCGGCGYLNVLLSGECAWPNLENGDDDVNTVMHNSEADISSDAQSDSESAKDDHLETQTVMTTRSSLYKRQKATQNQEQIKKKLSSKKLKTCAKKESLAKGRRKCS